MAQLQIDKVETDLKNRIPFDDVIESMLIAGVIKNSDLAVLDRYKELFFLYQAAKKEVEERGLTINTDTRYEKVNPAVALMMQCHAQLLSYEKEFGLTPASKRKITKIQEDNTIEINEYEESRKAAFDRRRSLKE